MCQIKYVHVNIIVTHVKKKTFQMKLYINFSVVKEDLFHVLLKYLDQFYMKFSKGTKFQFCIYKLKKLKTY